MRDFSESSPLFLTVRQVAERLGLSAGQVRALARSGRIPEIHYTPKHGSWLNMAEIELSVLNNHGLAERIADLPSMRQQTNAWMKNRNAAANKIDLRFTNKDARIKLKRLYPKLQD